MKVDFNIGQNIGKQNNILNIQRINQSLVKNNESNTDKTRTQRKDTVSISKKGRANKLLENLMKQKESVIEQREKLISSTLEKGGNLKEIKTQLETYDEQLKNIEDQIKQNMTQDMEKQADKIKEKEDKEPKTKEEIQNEKLSDITNVVTDLKQSQMLTTVKSKMDSKVKVLEEEIRQDGTRFAEPTMSRTVQTKKETQSHDIQRQALKLSSEIGENLVKATDEVNGETTLKAVKVEDDKETNKLDDINKTIKEKLAEKLKEEENVQ